MKQTMEFYDFRNAFREHRPDNFTDDGLIALWQHLEELEDQTGVEMNFNLVDISCSYAEYASPKEHVEECGDAEECGDHVLVATTATGGLIVMQT